MKLRLEFSAIRNEGARINMSVVKGVIGRLEKRGTGHLPMCYADETQVTTSREGEVTIVVYVRDASRGASGRNTSNQIISTLKEIRSRDTGLLYFSSVCRKIESPNLFSKQQETPKEASASDKEEIMDVPFEESESKEEVATPEPIETSDLRAQDIDIDKLLAVTKNDGPLIVAHIGKRCSGKSAYIALYVTKAFKHRRILYLDTERHGWALKAQLEAIARHRGQSLTELANDEKFFSMSSFARSIPQEFETPLDYFLEVVRTRRPEVLVIDSLEELIPPYSHDIYGEFRRLMQVVDEIAIAYLICTLGTQLANVVIEKSDVAFEFQRVGNEISIRRAKTRFLEYPFDEVKRFSLDEVYKK